MQAIHFYPKNSTTKYLTKHLPKKKETNKPTQLPTQVICQNIVINKFSFEQRSKIIIPNSNEST